MIALTVDDVVRICAGELLGDSGDLRLSGVSTDSRQVAPGDLFVALKGPTHDGHDHVAAAVDAGAIAALVSKPLEAPCPRIVVPDTLLAYGRLGAAARQASEALTLAVSGSAGKTTCKQFLGTIAAGAGPSLASVGNENNEIGVPRLLLRLEPEHQYLVVEMAMRGPGEIAYLTGLARPHIGIITNVGDAHIGRLGSREAIAKAKAELLAGLPADGVAVLNADDFFFGLMSEIAPCPVVSFGFGERPEGVVAHVRGADVRAHGTDPARFRLHIGPEEALVQLRLPGEHNVANALAAAAGAHAAAIPFGLIVAGLEEAGGAAMRSQVLDAPGGFRIINDAYNASPTSTPRALTMLSESPGQRVFVFGDMLELGPGSEAAHRKIGRLAAAAGVDWLIAVGQEAAYAAEEADAAGIQADAVADPASALALLNGALQPGDTVLVKASRGMALERVVEGLMAVG